MIKRAFRTMLFMVIMVVSLLVSCAPLLISIVDVVVPCVLLSTFACCTSCFGLYGGWTTYNVRTSIVDIPLLSLIRSLAIFCKYLWICMGSFFQTSLEFCKCSFSTLFGLQVHISQTCMPFPVLLSALYVIFQNFPCCFCRCIFCMWSTQLDIRTLFQRHSNLWVCLSFCAHLENMHLFSS